MTNKDIFYQYKTLNNSIELKLKSLNPDLKFDGNILNFYNYNNTDKLELYVTATIDHPESVLPLEFKNSFEYLDVVTLWNSNGQVLVVIDCFGLTNTIVRTYLLLI
jgi:hypothetical protein